MTSQSEEGGKRRSALDWLIILLTIAALGWQGHGLYRRWVPRPPDLYPPDEIPVPPRQREEWEPPPNGLPEAFVQATKVLFSQGMADPRGCPYREVAVTAGSTTGNPRQTVRTRGWLLPEGEEDAEQRYAVCWNGHLYAVSPVGAEVDLERDVHALLDGPPPPRGAFRPGRRLTIGGWRRQEEATAVRHDRLGPLKCCLLLRLGKGKLATEAWRKWSEERVFAGEVDERDIYAALAAEWAWSLFGRTLCAHMRGDDETALLAGRALLEARPAIMREVDRQGRFGPALMQFLWQLDDLVRDQERRAHEAEGEPLEEIAGNAEERVDALIDRLDEVYVRRRDLRKPMPWAEAPIVNALVAEGAPAVEPLLECLEHDDRLTRSVQANLLIGPWDRTVVGVQDAACHALCRILGAKFYFQDYPRRSLTRQDARTRRWVVTSIRDFLRRQPVRPSDSPRAPGSPVTPDPGTGRSGRSTGAAPR